MERTFKRHDKTTEVLGFINVFPLEDSPPRVWFIGL